MMVHHEHRPLNFGTARFFRTNPHFEQVCAVPNSAFHSWDRTLHTSLTQRSCPSRNEESVRGRALHTLRGSIAVAIRALK